MRQLFIHKEDPSTDFLAEIYRGVPGTVLRAVPPAAEVARLISLHDRVVMLGHGSPGGLFGTCGYAVSEASVPALAGKDNVYVWCHASTFVHRHRLSGFSTGMFISEAGEALLCGIRSHRRLDREVAESNWKFSRLVRESITLPAAEIHAAVKAGYGRMPSAVEAYNSSLLLYFPPGGTRPGDPMPLHA